MQRRAERGERRAVGLALHNRPGQQRPRSNLSTLGLGREPRNRLSRSTGAAGVKKRRGPVFLLIDHHGDFRHLARALSKTDAKKRLILRDRTHRSAVPAPVAFMPRSAQRLRCTMERLQCPWSAFDTPWSAMTDQGADQGETTARLQCRCVDATKKEHAAASVIRGVCEKRQFLQKRRKEAIFCRFSS